MYTERRNIARIERIHELCCSLIDVKIFLCKASIVVLFLSIRLIIILTAVTCARLLIAGPGSKSELRT